MTPADRQKSTKPKVFISHSPADAWIAQRFAEKIEDAGGEYFLYETGIDTGEAVAERIRLAMDECTDLLVLFTRASQTRPYIWVEVGAALQARLLIAGVVDGMTVAEFLASDGVPGFFHDRNMRSLNQVDAYFEELARRRKAAVK